MPQNNANLATNQAARLQKRAPQQQPEVPAAGARSGSGRVEMMESARRCYNLKISGWV